MMDKNKTKAQLISELEELRTRVASFEASRLERDRDKREVGEAEEIYRSLVDLSPDPVVILQGDRFQFVSKAFTEVFGYTQEDTDGGMSFYELVQEDDKESVRQQYEDRLAGKQVTRTYRIDLITKEGMVVPCETSARLIQYNGEPADLVLIRDISERERIAEILRKSEESYRAVVEDQTELICRFLPDKTLTFVNNAYCRYFGLNRDELIGSSFMRLIPESEHEYVENHFASLTIENPAAMHEHQVIAPNGEIHWQQWTNRAIFDDENRIIEFQSVGRDITDSKRAEEELRKAHDYMEQKVRERTSELLKANEQLRESEAYMRGILNAAPAGIGLVRERELDWISHRMCEMLGYSADELVGQSARLAYESDEEFDRVGRVKYAEIEKRGVGSVETRFKRKDGSVLDVLLCSSAVDPGDLSKGAIFTVLDITERKEAEEELLESEQRYRSLFKNNHSVMLLIDPESADIVDANPAACSFYGWTREELASMKITDINMLSNEQVFEEMERAKSEERNHFFFRHRLANEEIRDVEVYSGPIRLHGKEFLYSIIHDVSARKLVERALQESEERHRLLLQASPDPIVVYDIEGKATYINPAFEQVFGWSSEELLGRRIDFVPEENWPETEAAIERMLLGESILAFETRRLTKDGRILNIQLSSSLFHDRDGKPEGNIVILRDVTKQILAAEALRESEENFKALAENANDGILIAVGEGTHVYANSRASEITGYSIDELQEITLHEFTAPEEVEKVADKFSRRLAGENVPGQYETLLVRKSGEIFPAELSSGRSFWEGQPASIVIFRDITGRKQAEKALRKREAELEIRASELEELNAALRVLLKKREEDQKELEEKVLSNVKELVLPYVERLKKGALGVKRDTYLNILQSNLENIVSPFVRKLSSTYLGLTPTEIHVANLVKEARDTKTIAQLLNMSPRTVETHRQNIRKKLGLKNKKANLRTHLLSMQ